MDEHLSKNANHGGWCCSAREKRIRLPEQLQSAEDCSNLKAEAWLECVCAGWINGPTMVSMNRSQIRLLAAAHFKLHNWATYL